MVEYSFDRDDYRPRDDSFRDRERRERERDRREFDAIERGQQELFEMAELQRQRDAVREVVNNDAITMDSSMIDAINNPNVSMTSAGKLISSLPAGRFSQSTSVNTLPRTRKKTKGDKLQSRALKLANLKLRKKNGKLRKGKTMRDVMKLAHRLKRKM